MQKNSVCESRKALDAIDFNEPQLQSSPDMEYTLKDNPYESYDETMLWNAFNEEIARMGQNDRQELESAKQKLDITQEERDLIKDRLRAEQEKSQMLSEQMHIAMEERERYKKQFQSLKERQPIEERNALSARERIRTLENTLERIQADYQRERMTSVDAESRNAMIIAENRKLYEENRKLNKKARKLKKQTSKYQIIAKERDAFAAKLEKMKHEILMLHDDAHTSKQTMVTRNGMMQEEMEKLQKHLDVLSQSQMETCSNHSTITLEEEIFPTLDTQLDENLTESDSAFHLPSGGFVMVKSQDSLETEDFMSEVDAPSTIPDPPPKRPIRQPRSALRPRPAYHIPSDDILLQTLAEKQRRFNLFQTILSRAKLVIRNVSRYDEIIQFLEDAQDESQNTRLSIPSLYPLPILIPQSSADIIGRRQ